MKALLKENPPMETYFCTYLQNWIFRTQQLSLCSFRADKKRDVEANLKRFMTI